VLSSIGLLINRISIETEYIAGLPTPNFQMGFMKVQMGYIWGTFLFRMGYITGVHYFPPAIEDLIEKTDEITFLL